jgi:hypothetical protein
MPLLHVVAHVAEPLTVPVAEVAAHKPHPTDEALKACHERASERRDTIALLLAERDAVRRHSSQMLAQLGVGLEIAVALAAFGLKFVR